MVNFIVGYFIVINLIGISLIWIRVNTDYIKMSEKILNIIYLIVSMIEGFVGILIGAEMFEYKNRNKMLKIWIPLLVFIEACTIIFILYQNSIKST